MISNQALRRTFLLILSVFSVFFAGPRSQALGADNSWLTKLNQYRSMAGLTLFKLDDQMTAKATDFARHLAYKEFAEVRAGKSVAVEDHFVNAVVWWFAGHEDFVAGGMANAQVGSKALTPIDVLDGWIADPINRLSLLAREPPGVSAAYGDFCAKGSCAATLYLSDHGLSIGGYFRGLPENYQKPVLFPPDHSIIDLISLGHQSPELFHNCAFRNPTGLPITIQLGRWISPKITAGSLIASGKLVQACAIDATNYLNSDKVAENHVRHKLTQFGALVIVPRFPLLSNTKYHVQAVVADQGTYDWSFSTSTKAVAVP